MFFGYGACLLAACISNMSIDNAVMYYFYESGKRMLGWNGNAP